MSARRPPVSAKAGLPPGTMVHVGRPTMTPAVLTVLEYDRDRCVEPEVTTADDCGPLLDSATNTWLNVAGIADVHTVGRIGSLLGLHPLLLEDIVDTRQRPKIEDYSDCLAIFLRMLQLPDEESEVVSEQVCIVLGQSYVVSFQEDSTDVFDAVRGRIRTGGGQIRASGPDYLAYALIDAVVDQYFHVLEHISDESEGLAEALLESSSADTLAALARLKREMVLVRRAVWPLRDVLSALLRDVTPLVAEDTRPYMRDVYDHTVQIIDVIESDRDALSSMMDIYLTSVSNRTNEIVKVLTIFSAVFIPLTFLAGVYGMNFEYFPELEWRYGYAMFWVLAGSIALLLLGYLRRKGWL